MRGAAALLLAAAAVTGNRASAYVRTTTDKMAAVRWSRSCVVVTAHDADPPPNLTPDMVVTAARAAAAVWSHESLACSGFELQVAVEETADAPAANDGKNNLVFRRTSWPYDPSALAITTVFALQDSGQIKDADVELNAVEGGRFKWGDLVANIGTGVHVEDLQNTLTHEFGHLLGLDHNCFLSGTSRHGVDNTGAPVPDCDHASAQIQAATMFAAVAPGDVERRSLTDDDIAGVCAIYPAATATSCSDTSDGLASGCSFGGRQGRAAGLLLTVLLISAAARRRFRRRG
jgi:hypothetical protein